MQLLRCAMLSVGRCCGGARSGADIWIGPSTTLASLSYDQHGNGGVG